MKEEASRLSDRQAQRLWAEIARDLQDGAGLEFALEPDQLARVGVLSHDDLRRFLKQF